MSLLAHASSVKRGPRVPAHADPLKPRESVGARCYFVLLRLFTGRRVDKMRGTNDGRGSREIQGTFREHFAFHRLQAEVDAFHAQRKPDLES
jgi:hypothetical protein